MQNLANLRLFALLPLFLATYLSAQGPNNRLLFVVNMNGGQEVPAVSTEARGLVTLMLSEDLSSINVHGIFAGLSGPITGCHIHNAVAGVNGPVVTNFSTNITGNELRASIPTPANFFALALTDKLYLNVHTAANPGGEIRGQLELKTDLQYAAILNGLEETPSVLTTATGIFRMSYFPGNTVFHYFATYNGLSGLATAAHIHNAAAGASGPVVLPLTAGLTGTLVGEFDLVNLAADFTQKLENKQLYVNVHTAANPTGEIRGQLRRLGPITFEATLNGDQETPPVNTAAIGSAVASVNATLDSLTYFVSVTGLTPTAAHFHLAAAGSAGPVIVGLTPTPAPNFYTATVPINNTQLAELLKGNVYVNVHTAANPTGEIRGQVMPNLQRVYAFDLCGSQEVPANSTTGKGSAVITTDFLNTHLSYLYVVDGLTGPATAAHIHQAAIGASGPVYLPVNIPVPFAGSGRFSITGDDVVKLESGNTYLNVHTAANPGGEIRGQVVRNLLCSTSSGTYVPEIADFTVAPNPSAGETEVRFEAFNDFSAQLVVSDLFGRVLSTKNITVASGKNAVTINLSTYPTGMYLVQIQTAQHQAIHTVKLVKD